MKKTLIISLLMVFSAITLSSCDKKSGKDNNVSGNHSHENLSLKNTESGERGNAIVWCALIVSLLNAGFTIVCFVRMDERSKNRYGRLNKKVEKLEEKFNWEKPQSSKSAIVKQELSDTEIDLIVDRVRDCMRLDLKEKEEEQKKVVVKKNVEKPKVEVSVPQEPKIMKKMYASAANGDNAFFMKVTEQPDENTIYILSLIDDDTANFVVYDNAKDIIIACEDYLKNVCNVIGRGNDIESCEPGLAKKTNDGTWKVVKRANVKFV